MASGMRPKPRSSFGSWQKPCPSNGPRINLGLRCDAADDDSAAVSSWCDSVSTLCIFVVTFLDLSTALFQLWCSVYWGFIPRFFRVVSAACAQLQLSTSFCVPHLEGIGDVLVPPLVPHINKFTFGSEASLFRDEAAALPTTVLHINFTSMASGMCPKPCSSFGFQAMFQQWLPKPCERANQVPLLVPDIMSRLRLQWPALDRLEDLFVFPLGFNSLSSLGSGAYIALLRRLSIMERSMSGHVSFALQVGFSPRFFLFPSLGTIGFFISRCVFCAISCHASQRALFPLKLVFTQCAPYAFDSPCNGGKVLPGRQDRLEVLLVSSFSVGVQLFLLVSFPSA